MKSVLKVLLYSHSLNPQTDIKTYNDLHMFDSRFTERQFILIVLV